MVASVSGNPRKEEILLDLHLISQVLGREQDFKA